MTTRILSRINHLGDLVLFLSRPNGRRRWHEVVQHKDGTWSAWCARGRGAWAAWCVASGMTEEEAFGWLTEMAGEP